MKIAVSELLHCELSGQSGEKYSLSGDISDNLGLKNVSVRHEILQPGRRASGTHTHSKKEEMIFVLEGTPTAVLNGQETLCSTGESFAFMPGNSNFHYVENRTLADVRILVISSVSEGDEAIFV
jgi:uncharacterized cupin superfamily protein